MPRSVVADDCLLFNIFNFMQKAFTKVSHDNLQGCLRPSDVSTTNLHKLIPEVERELPVACNVKGRFITHEFILASKKNP